MIHVDTKQLAGFERVGHRITFEKVHVALDDAPRLADVEVIPDEQQATMVGFFARAMSWFRLQGISCLTILGDLCPQQRLQLPGVE